MANPAVVVDFVANTKDLQSGFREASGHATGFGSKLKSLGKAGLAAAGAAGIAGLTAAVKTGIDEYSQASKVTAQTNAAIKSTGKAAGVSTKQIQDLAGSLMKKSGVDDEAIQSGENLLLTFTNIRNEAGKGNDVFNQTTKAALDMSVALGTDMKTASMQLGKALNDPIKGVTKLTRSGVTFTDAQKKSIESLVAHGKTLEAQKIILAEVNKEFGGSAEAAGKTLPGQINILKESFNNLAGQLIGSLVPAFTKLLGAFTGVLSFLGKYQGVLPVLVGVLAGLAAVTFTVSAATSAYVAITTIAKAASAAWTAVQIVLNAVLTANPIGIVVVAVAALVAAFIVAYKTSDTFRNIVDRAFDAVLNAAKAVWNWLKGNWPLLLGILTGPFGLAVGLIIRNWGDITGAARDAYNSIKSTLTALKDWIGGAFTSGLRAVINIVSGIFDFIADGARDAYSSVRNNLNGIVNFIEGIVGKVRSAASSVANAIKGPINAIIEGWNSLAFPRVSIKIPSFKIGKKKFGGGDFGFGPFPFPNIPTLAQGGVVDSATLALIGEGQGREIVAPEALLRQLLSEQRPQVRVFIGDQELRGLVRTEIVDNNTRLARGLLAGGVS